MDRNSLQNGAAPGVCRDWDCRGHDRRKWDFWICNFGHLRSHIAVGQQHKLLYKPVALHGLFATDIQRLALFVHNHLHLGTLKLDCTMLKTLSAQYSSDGVELENLFAERSVHILDDPPVPPRN